jgi:aspartate racemase
VSIVGLVGGLGPESTIDYYRRILEAWAAEDPTSSPSIVIDSLDVQIGLRLAGGDRAGLIEYLHGSLRRLAGAGVDFIAMTANTAHMVFDELAARSAVPLLSIVEVAAEEARSRGLKRLGLLGTRFTMEAPFYPDVFGRHGLTVVPPTDAERSWVHDRYVGQLLKGDFRDETRREFVALIARLRDEERIDGVVLGGTEIPLLLKSAVVADVPALDTTALHVGAIVRRLRAPRTSAPAALD